MANKLMTLDEVASDISGRINKMLEDAKTPKERNYIAMALESMFFADFGAISPSEFDENGNQILSEVENVDGGR